MKIIKGDLLKLAKQGEFNVIVHGCNCFTTMGAGIALQIKNQFPEAYAIDRTTLYGDYNKMGNYTYVTTEDKFDLVNLYTQYNYGQSSPGCKIPLDYNALVIGLRKINIRWKGLKVGLPWIGCGLAGGDKEMVQKIIERELYDVDITIVEYENS